MIEFSIPAAEYRATYFEKKPMLLRQVLRERIVSWPDIDELLFRIEPQAPFMQLFKDGELPYENYVENGIEMGLSRKRLMKVAFYSYLHSGATVVLNRLENFSLMAERLCAEVGVYCGQPTMSNAYLTFSGPGTFGKHWDTHDVFAIQLLGKKRWQVFAPTLPLPLSHQTSKHSGHTPPSQSIIDCELQAGDVLYLPRGWWHQAIPLDEASFHISIGAYAPTVLDYIQWACRQRLSGIAAARVGLIGNESIGNTQEIINALTNLLSNPTELENFKASLAERERVHSEFALQATLDSRATLSEQTFIALTNAARIREGQGIIVKGKRLKLDPLRRSLIELLERKGVLALQTIYREMPSVSQFAVRAALLELSVNDVVSLRE